MPDGILPEIWVRAHPFGDRKNKDAHGEYFDAKTNFYDSLLPTAPISYYHNRTPDGELMGEPIAIGMTTDRTYREDGRWDKVKFFDDVSQDIAERIQKAIESGTLRSSPTTVPDFHKVEADGHISHWLSGAIAIFDAEGKRQPANQHAIGITEMKALFDQAGIAFPDLMKGVDMAQTAQKTNLAQSLKDKIKELYQAVTQGDHSDEWSEFFGADDAATDEPADKTEDGGVTLAAKEQTMADEKKDTAMNPSHQNDDLRLQFEKQQTEMKAILESNQELQRRLDRADIEKWIDMEVNAKGVKVPPAEREQVVTLALNLKGAAHPTMKSADGAETTAFDAFKKTIEARTVKVPLEGDYTFMKFDSDKKDDKTVSPERKKQLLEMTELGRQAVSEGDRKH